MQKAKLLFDYSPWFIIACLAIGAVYAYIMYQKKGPWGEKTNYFLAGLRFLLASTLALLLIGPFLRQIENTIESPTYIFAIDNSSSIATMVDSIDRSNLLGEINSISENIKTINYGSEIRTFDQKNVDATNQISFDFQSTNLDNILKDIQTDYEGRPVAGVILVSDGIYNQGVSPSYSTYKFPIYTIGVGDTIPKPDININAIYYNKIAYQGNQFPIVAEILSHGLSGKTIDVRVTQQGKTMNSKQITLTGNQTLDEVELLVDAENQGLQHYVVETTVLEEEFTNQNNRRDVYVEIIEGKEKILLVARSPHPDIKMIRNAIIKNDNYEFIIHIPGINAFKQDKYDLAIFHQIPDVSNTAQRLMEDLLAQNISTWFIIGANSNLDYFNRINGVFEVNTNNFQTDRVTPSYNRDFQRFIFDPDFQQKINDFSPIFVPYGDIEMTLDAQIILFQQVGSIVTKKPILAIRDNGDKKMAVMAGEGIWQWRLQEFASNENQDAFDDLISKLVQYLSSKEDKRKFKVYPINNEISDTEKMVFETEIYNDIFERIYDKEINLTITNENNINQQYTYNISENNSRYEVTGLSQGIYKYRATTTLDGQPASSAGEFTVSALQIEALNLTANHQLLRAISIQNGGEFFSLADFNQLEAILTNQEVQGTIHTSEAYMPIINLPWVFFLLLLFVSIEWFTRKYNGGY